MYRGERFNSVTHLIGVGLGIAGLVLLLISQGARNDPWRATSFAIYGASLILLYSFSTLYHSLQGRAKRVLQKLDHLAIYLLIAGSYTPFTLVTLRGPWGWTLFGLVWGLALLGVVQELWLGQRSRRGSMILYLLMGWLVVIAAAPLVKLLPIAGLAWLAGGGLAYTAGIYFYVNDQSLRHAHGIWHLFVLTGSICHYWCVLRYVA